MTQRTTLQVSDAGELRDALSKSAVFDMFDCAVEIEAPLDSDTEEIERIVKVLEAAINVVDVVVLPDTLSYDKTQYTVEITEVPANFISRTKRNK